MKRLFSSGKIKVVFCLSLLILVFVSCSGDKKSNEPKKETIVLKYADSQPVGYPSILAMEEFAKIVAERTDNRIKVEIYAGGQLGDEKSNIEQLQFGALDLARVSIGPLSEFAKSLNVFQIPYIFDDADHMWKVVNGPIGKELTVDLEKSKMECLSWFEAGSRNFYTGLRPIKTLEDLTGIKMRVMESSLMIDMASALGTNPTPMNSGEVYSGLQTGIIEGAENNIPTYVANAHNEVAKYMTLDGHIRMPEPLLISASTKAKLSEEDLKIIREVALETSSIQRKLWKDYENNSIKKAEEKGTEFIILDESEMNRFREACESVREKHGKEYVELLKRISASK